MMVLLISLGVFLSMMLLLLGSFVLYDVKIYGDPSRVRQRLMSQTVAAQTGPVVDIVRKDARNEEPWVSALMVRFAPLVALKRLLRHADSQMPVGVLLLLSAISGLSGATVSLYLHLGSLALLGSAIGAGSLPILFQVRKKKRRLKVIEQQLPDALDLVARTLLAGHAFVMGLKMVGEQLEDPIRAEFQKAFEEINFGVSVAESMKALSERIDSLDVKFFVTSLLVQLETGGNLAEIIQSISRLIRARFELKGKVRALSAEGRISALIMFSLPFLLGLALFYISPDYISLLFTDPAGHKMVGGGLVMMVLGMIVTKRMVNIRV